MNLYQHHTDREIRAVLQESAKLTYDAQCNLLRELKVRALGMPTQDLEKHIEETEAAIDNLKYLKDLGFTYHQDAITQMITVKRRRTAIVMDVVAIFLGLLLFVAGLVYFWLLMAMFFGNNEFTLTKLFAYTLMIAAGMIGFRMLAGIDRFLDYISFVLEQSGTTVKLKKGGIKEIQKMDTTSLKIHQEEEELILRAGEIEIMRCTADNLVHRKTLEALLQKLTEN